jgi:hypothetical protein
VWVRYPDRDIEGKDSGENDNERHNGTGDLAKPRQRLELRVGSARRGTSALIILEPGESSGSEGANPCWGHGEKLDLEKSCGALRGDP